MDKFIPLSIPNFEGNEKKYVNDALDQGWVSTGGAYITKFEKELEEFLHVKNVAACQSGTAALHLALVEAGVKSGDIVLAPPLTFIAAVNPIKYQSAMPIFIDCDESLCMDPIKLKNFCEEECEWNGTELKYKGAVVRAVIVVHVFGNMADMISIMETARQYNMKVVEDATEALGTYYTDGPFVGKYAGTIGDFGAYSFNGNKIITTGGGGAVTASNTEETNHMRYLSTQAKDDPLFYVHNEVGYNYRMTNLQAALGVAQMEELPEFILRKRNNYESYKKYFEGFSLCRLLPYRNGILSNSWFYSLELNMEKINAPLKQIIVKLKEMEIQTRAIWGLINEQLPYLKEYAYRLVKAPYYASRILNIPCSTQLKENEIEYVSESVKKVLEGYAHGL